MDNADEYGEYDDYPESDGYDEYQQESPESVVDTTTVIPSKPKEQVIFVTISDIKKLLDEKCEELVDLLSISKDQAMILYHYFNWRKDKVESEWFENMEEISIKAGLSPASKDPEQSTDEILCPMCFDSKDKSEITNFECNHYICSECLRDYIQFNVTCPENIFFWKCPFQGCNIIIPDSVNRKFIEENQVAQYNKKLARVYSDTSKSVRWCPAPDCEYASEVESISANTIVCPCTWVYCFKCGLEDHQPCTCDATRDWLKRDSGGGANAQWLLTFTKDCPKCKRPIEKNQGCNYMRCRHGGCGFEFCWLCLADWKTHNDHFKCNKFDKMSKSVTSFLEKMEEFENEILEQEILQEKEKQEQKANSKGKRKAKEMDFEEQINQYKPKNKARK